MQIVIGFAPFIAFAVLTRWTGVAASLWIAAAIAAGLALRTRFAGRSLKFLEVGSVALFALVALYCTIAQSSWSLPLVRAAVDAGLVAIVILSIAIRQPFTLQYAREQVPPEVQASPLFLRVNMIISSVWALALAVDVAADLAMEYAPGAPLWLDIAAIAAALVGAALFTRWYPERVRESVRRAAKAA